MGLSCEARDHFLNERPFPRSLDNRKEQVQKILSRADVRIGGDREWDITVNNDGVLFPSSAARITGPGRVLCGWLVGLPRARSAFFENPERPAGPKRALGLAAGPAMGAIRRVQSANETAREVGGRKTL